ncbi:hypothetical protein F5B19DRAFT_238247 [Rostrohypoxylon terebratum]|nr:hypothetical protein F5B19DRAFT_238247 [Rostrohypoxylon terebratum]
MSSPGPSGSGSGSGSVSRSRQGRRRSRNQSRRQQTTASQPEPQNQQYSDEDSAEDVEAAPQPQPQRRRRQRTQTQQQQQQSGGPLGGVGIGGVDQLLPVNNVGETANNLTNSATSTLGNVAGGALNQGGGGGGKSDTLRLRLDLNLEVEVTLKARIHGDLELALLYVIPFPSAFCLLYTFPVCLHRHYIVNIVPIYSIFHSFFICAIANHVLPMLYCSGILIYSSRDTA